MKSNRKKATSAAKPRRGLAPLAVYTAIKDDILNMRLEPGHPLDEMALTRRYKWSRTPIREALVRLVSEGLATTLSNRNIVVSTINLFDMPAYVDALMIMARMTARLAAMHRSDDDLVAIRECQGRFATAVQEADALGMLETNREFHLAVAAAGRNKYFAELLSKLINEELRVLRAYYLSFRDRVSPEYVNEHESIIVAIEARDVERADAVAQHHALHILRGIEGVISQTLRGIEFGPINHPTGYEQPASWDPAVSEI